MSAAKTRRGICLVLALLFSAVLFLPVFTAFAETPAQKLERLKKELDAIQNDISAAEQKKDNAEALRQSYYEKMNNLKAQLAVLREDTQALQAEINDKNAQIEAKVLAAAQEKHLFEQRLRSMYEMSRQSNLAILLGIDDPARQLIFAENLQCISKHDSELIRRINAQQQELQAQSDALNADLEALNAREAELNDISAQYAQAIRQADASISDAEAQQQALQEAQTMTQEEYEKAQEEWNKWAAAEHTDFDYSGDAFAWPIPGYTYLSSDFNHHRFIFGRWDVHRGMDVPAPIGVKVYAAESGTVRTNNHPSYGISVKISHGSGLSTIYGHFSARCVEQGDYVEKGQLIGYVGASGNVTGPHLHFEVNLNGRPVSPRPYLGAFESNLTGVKTY